MPQSTAHLNEYYNTFKYVTTRMAVVHKTLPTSPNTSYINTTPALEMFTALSCLVLFSELTVPLLSSLLTAYCMGRNRRREKSVPKTVLNCIEYF